MMKEKRYVKNGYMILMLFFMLITLYGVLSHDVSVCAAMLTSDEGFLYSVNGDGKTVKILGYDEDIHTASELEIPKIIDGKEVTTIGASAFYEKKQLSKVTLPDTIVKIEDDAFYGMGEVEINLPVSLEYIGEYAFRNDQFVNMVEFPDSLSYIGQYAFYGCRGVKTLKIGKNIKEINRKAIDFYSVEEFVVADDNPYLKSVDGILYDKNMTKVVKCPMARTEDVVISNTVTVIGEYAFEDTEIDKVVIPDSVTEIESGAFYHSDISQINLPEKLTKLSSIILCGCYNITEVTIPDSVEEIGFSALAGTSITSITIPRNVKVLDGAVFQGCDYLEEVDVKANLIEVGSNVMEDTPWEEQQFANSNFAILKDVLVATKGLSGDVRIPDSVRVICRLPFWYSSGDITSITIPDTVKYIHSEGMTLERDDHPNLKAVWVEEGNTEFVSDNGILFDKNHTKLLDIPHAYSGTIVVPKSVKNIEWDKYEWDGLPNVNMIVLENPNLLEGLNNVDRINKSVVIVDTEGNILECGSDYETALKNIIYQIEPDGNVTVTGIKQSTQSIDLVIPQFINGLNVTKISEYAFMNCSNILSLKIPKTVEYIGTSALENCVNLSSIYVYNDDLLNYFDQKTVEMIGYKVTVYDASGNEYRKTEDFTSENEDYLYAKRNDGTVIIKEYLGSEETVVIPEQIDGMDVTAIGSDAFCVLHHSNCRNISSITLPNTLREIHSMAFYFIPIKEINIPEGVTMIGDAAFAWGTLEKVTFPSTLRSIGSNAFALCGLNEIILPDGLETVGTDAFTDNSNVTSVYIPASVKSLGGESGLAFNNNANLKTIDVDSENQIYSSVDGVLFSKDQKNLLMYPQAKEGTVYEIPNGVVTIAQKAFRTSTYNNGIGGAGIYTEGVEIIKIPASVQEIALDAFTGDYSLKDVIVDEANQYYKSVDGVLYSKDETILYVYPKQKEGAFYELLSSAKKIADYAFYENKQLEKIVLSEKLESIGERAFYDCSALATVTIYDSVLQIGESAFWGCADSEYTGLEFTIICYPSSYAHQYAMDNDYAVILLEEKEKDESTDKPEISTEESEDKPEEDIKTEKPTDEPEATTENLVDSTDVKATGLKITGMSKKIAAGKKIALTPVFTPSDVTNQSLVWTSSNTKYATVNSKGVVTTKKKGAGKSVTITATTQDGSNIKATYKLTIMKHAVKNIKLTAKSKTVQVGKKLTLKATVKTTGKNVNKVLQWTSSNTKYATVTKKGVVSAKKAGKGKTVKITAKAMDGTNKKATIKIKIK